MNARTMILLIGASLLLNACVSTSSGYDRYSDYGRHYVVTPNHVLEGDPDPNVRFELVRDWNRGRF